MDGSHAFDFPLADLSPGQHAALDAALARENIEGRWTGTTLHVDIAYEARVSTLVDQARGGVLPAAPVASAPPIGGPVMDAPVGPPQSPPPGPVLTPTNVYPGPMAPPGPAGAAYGAGSGYAPGTYGTPGGYGGYGYTPAPRMNGLAIASLVAAIIGLGCGIVASIPAVIMGHMARRSIRDSGGAEQGDGMALAGLIIGYIITGLTVAILIFYIILIVAFAGSSGTR